MDSYYSHREVEKVKPFEERARRAIESLKAHRLALGLILGADTLTCAAMHKAEELLDEARLRGVKGKDA